MNKKTWIIIVGVLVVLAAIFAVFVTKCRSDDPVITSDATISINGSDQISDSSDRSSAQDGNGDTPSSSYESGENNDHNDPDNDPATSSNESHADSDGTSASVNESNNTQDHEGERDYNF